MIVDSLVRHIIINKSVKMSMGSVLFTKVLNDRDLKRKCFGIGKNYFTKAL